MHHLTSDQLSQQKHTGSIRDLQENLIRREQQYNPMFQVETNQQATPGNNSFTGFKRLFAFGRA